MIPFADWAVALARAAMPTFPVTTATYVPMAKAEDPRLEPVDIIDQIDELVNWQLSEGRREQR